MASKPIFLDTAYVLALFNTRDQWHQPAIELQQKLNDEKTPLITTEFVLVEIGDGLSARTLRDRAAKIVRTLNESPLVTVVPASTDLLLRGLDLYENRHDKDWGLTDCTSFIIMQDREILDVLTTDRHFRQAGFNPLLNESE